MPNQYIVDYLKKNKDKFSVGILKQKLLKAEYPENQIEEAVQLVYRMAPPPAPKKISKIPAFWDFWHKKVYTSGKEKIFDFVIGFIFAIILKYIISFGLRSLLRGFGFYGYFSFFLSPLIFLVIIIHFFIKKKYIAYGIICEILFPFLGILGYIF